MNPLGLESELKPDSMYACLAAAESDQLSAAVGPRSLMQLSTTAVEEEETSPVISENNSNSTRTVEENRDLKRQVVFLHQQVGVAAKMRKTDLKTT